MICILLHSKYTNKFLAVKCSSLYICHFFYDQIVFLFRFLLCEGWRRGKVMKFDGSKENNRPSVVSRVASVVALNVSTFAISSSTKILSFLYGFFGWRVGGCYFDEVSKGVGMKLSKSWSRVRKWKIEKIGKKKKTMRIIWILVKSNRMKERKNWMKEKKEKRRDGMEVRRKVRESRSNEMLKKGLIGALSRPKEDLLGCEKNVQCNYLKLKPKCRGMFG